ncbi:hypothetical protein [Parasutterella secunda]|uniref:hypothetical protein n=1 Tax=Parasutterella secunda TaxID=626947 RepID=UPI0025A446E9|nr:hypothetical protein [Parasutterella secunda]MDM8227744.1 hypothetical protein [Parasutterella secunda]
MSDGTEKTQENTKTSPWIAEVLPRATALSLVRAAQLARTLPVSSLARAQAIRNAEKKAKAECPNAFRDDDRYGK